ncbi:Liprin-beta-1, variant 3 [Clonorchis sinensis]|uniref:Liprin-beta-1, variant 3 n=1 Tax=Clonorchis sinensis TaxID=79923 RepID=A0A8T1MBY4_CLOSI|nr:Liprin-beta-1, variant 3 [Clonorchis sinensis]
MNGLHNGKTNLGLEDSFHNDLHGNRKLSFSDVNAKIKPVLRTSNSEAQIQGLLYALDSSVENLGDAEGRNLILPPNTRNFLRRFLQDSRGHLSTRDASCNTTINHVEVLSQPSVSRNELPLALNSSSTLPKDESLKSRVILLQNQVDAQSRRIAELEQKQEQPLKSLLNNMESLDKLDLLTEVSKQQLQIASLEQAKLALESQLQRMQEQLTDISLAAEKPIFGLPTSINQTNGDDALVSIPRRVDMSSPPPSVNMTEGMHLNGGISETRQQPVIPAHLRVTGLGNSPQSPLDLSVRPGLDLSRNNTALTGYDLHIPPNLLPTFSAMDNGGNLQTGGMLRSTHHKSISLNELRHNRLNSGMDTCSTQNYVGARSFLDQFRVPRLGISPNESTSSPVYSSPPPTDSSHLPPQYASDQHRQNFLTGTNRTPPPGKPEPTRNQQRAAGRTFGLRPSPQPDHSFATTVDGLPPPAVPAERPINPHSPIFRRARTPKQMQERFIHPATPPVSRRSAMHKSICTLPDRNENEYQPEDTNSSSHMLPRPKSTTRLRRLFTDNPFRWLSQRRNSTCEAPPKSASISVPPVTNNANVRSSLSAAYVYGRSNSLRAPRSSAFQKVNSTNSLWTTRDSRGPEPNGRIMLCDSYWNQNGGFAGGDQYAAPQSVPNMPNSLTQQPWMGGAGVESLPSSSSTRETPSDASQIHSFTPPIVTDIMEELGNSDFLHWDKDMVSAWLYELGLGYAVPCARRWLQQGADLVRAPRKSIEQELCIRNPLHLKKILLHLQIRTKEPILFSPDPPLIRMHLPTDFNVLAWLDDLGLSEYAGVFETAAIDAVVLNNLTLEDMVSMKITNELHVLSFRRGLQVLRRINFDLNGLCRDSGTEADYLYRENGGRHRSSHPDPTEILSDVDQLVNNNGDDIMSKSFSGSTHFTESPKSKRGASPVLPRRSNTVTDLKTSNVCSWTQYRVIAWLNFIELPEYARNLDGTGVHGALIMLEDRFNPDLLANILRIPSNKTLVRRHLSSKFVELVGNEVWERKQAVSNNPDIPALTQHSKIKLSRKRTFFMSHRKRKGMEYEEEHLCPVDIDSPMANLQVQDSNSSEHVPSESTSMQHMALRETDL